MRGKCLESFAAVLDDVEIRFFSLFLFLSLSLSRENFDVVYVLVFSSTAILICGIREITYLHVPRTPYIDTKEGRRGGMNKMFDKFDESYVKLLPMKILRCIEKKKRRKNAYFFSFSFIVFEVDFHGIK